MSTNYLYNILKIEGLVTMEIIVRLTYQRNLLSLFDYYNKNCTELTSILFMS